MMLAPFERIARAVPATVLVALLAGCQAPFLVFPGKSLQGAETYAADFRFARDYGQLRLEVNPDAPYSVWLRVVMIGDSLYIDAAEHRRWHDYLKANRNVRIGLGDHVYPARAIVVEDPEITGRFLPGRTVYRIEPRHPPR